MLDWARLLSEKIENTEPLDDFAGAIVALCSSVVDTFEVHDSVTDEELEAVFAEIAAIQESE